MYSSATLTSDEFQCLESNVILFLLPFPIAQTLSTLCGCSPCSLLPQASQFNVSNWGGLFDIHLNLKGVGSDIWTFYASKSVLLLSFFLRPICEGPFESPSGRNFSLLNNAGEAQGYKILKTDLTTVLETFVCGASRGQSPDDSAPGVFTPHL